MAKVLKGDFSQRGGKKAVKGEAAEPVPGYQVVLSLPFSDPLIWRRLRLPGQLTLADLHRVIQICLGWDDTEPHQFLVGKIFYQPGFGIENNERRPEYDEAAFRLHELEEGMQFIFSYLYDGGDGWEVQIGLEQIIGGGTAENHPVALDGARACPPETIGDIHQYQALLATLPDSGAATIEIEGLRPFDPASFELAPINEELKYVIADEPQHRRSTT